MNNFYKMFSKCSVYQLLRKNNSPLIMGICVGIAFSIILTPFLGKKCVEISFSSSNGMRLRDLRSNDVPDSEDFEPTINLNDNIEVNRRGNEDSQSSKLIRPRYYSTELGMKDKILVSVISTKETIGTYGVALNKTLNHFVDKIIFFLDGTGSKKLGLNIPIVGFKEYKPHIKIFRILSYISEIYIEDYNYFFFVTDHSYVNGKRVMDIIEHLSISQDIHMGALQNDQNALYCDLDSGIILSQSIMKSLAKELLWCTKHSYSDSDSDNLGRCILHSSNVPCKSSYQNQVYKTYSLQNNGWELSSYPEHNALVNSELEEALTVKNIRKTVDFNKLHMFFLQNYIIQTRTRISNLRQVIEETMKYSPLEISYPWPIGSPNIHTPPTRHDVIYWETFNATHIFMPNDLENVKPLSGVEYFDIMSVVNSSIKHLEEKYSEKFKLENLNYGHKRFDPTRGMDYLISLSLTNEKRRILNKKIEAFRGVTQPEFIPMPYVTENGRVNILIFIQSNDAAKAIDFMQRLQKEKKIEEVTITFCLLFNAGDSYLSRDDPYKGLKDVLKSFTKQFYNSGSRANYLHLTVPNEKPSNFALIDLSLKKFSNDSLILIIDVSSIFQPDFINRVRMNTIRGWQIFSPIPFILYHPDLVEDSKSYSKKEIKTKNGHFDKYYFDAISFYADDYMKARQLIWRNVPLFRSEKNLKNDRKSYNITVYEMFVQNASLHVLRGVEPSIVLPYEPIQCSAEYTSNVSEVDSLCEKRQIYSFGQRNVLSNLIYEYYQVKGKL
ncbi:UNVERIFIED_CONTAM: hypothetical protein RMT77_007322 [Armadillidium vulgare]